MPKVANSDHTVERTERILVHSERTTAGRILPPRSAYPR